jgi:hypothetical protein
MFKPTIAQLETIAIMVHARAHVADIAKALHVTAEDFIAWRQQMMALANDEAASVATLPAQHWSGKN